MKLFSPLLPKFKTNPQAGFTLVELLVVIFVIGILSALILTNLVGVRGRASDASLKNDLYQLKTALRLYYNDFQRYPRSQNGNIMGCWADADSECSRGGEFEASSVYMRQLPDEYEYYSDNLDSFVLLVELNNLSDESIEASQARCQSQIQALGLSAEIEEGTYAVCAD